MSPSRRPGPPRKTPVTIDNLFAQIPYYAMNFPATNYQNRYLLRVRYQVYVDYFLVQTSPPVDWWFVW
jgi:hypothetical protein